MKKLIFIGVALLFLTITSFAQTTSGYFSEVTKGQVTGWGQKGFTIGSTVAVKAGGAAYYIVSPALGTSASNVRNSFMGKKVLLGINITPAFADVNATLVVSVSGDNTNWVTLATLSADTTPDVTGTTWYLADFTSTYAPFVRFKFNGGGLTIGTSGYISFLYAIPN